MKAKEYLQNYYDELYEIALHDASLNGLDIPKNVFESDIGMFIDTQTIDSICLTKYRLLYDVYMYKSYDSYLENYLIGVYGVRTDLIYLDKLLRKEKLKKLLNVH